MKKWKYPPNNQSFVVVNNEKETQTAQDAEVAIDLRFRELEIYFYWHAGVDIFPNVLTFCEGIVLKF